MPGFPVLGSFMKTLIAVITCDKYENRLAAIENTWISDARKAGFDVQIFTGKRLQVPDDYLSLKLKTKALCQLALSEGYDRLLKIDDDTCVNVKRFKIITADYAGIRIGPNDAGCGSLRIPDKPEGTYPHEYASGGAYWLSRRSMEIVAAAPFNDDWAEDRWVGQVLADEGIELEILPNYAFWNPWIDQITVCTQFPNPDTLVGFYQR